MSLIAAETANEFWKVFNERVEAVKTSLRNPPEEETVAFILNTKATSTDLQRYATISTITLPAYDVKRSQDIIESLNKDIYALDIKLNPKKKFFFKSKLLKAQKAQEAAAAVSTNTPVQPVAAAQVPASSAATQATINSLLPPGGYIITQRANETILLTAEALRANTLATSAGSTAEVHAQLFIKDNKNCTITVPSLLGSVRIEYVSDCVIYLGACCTSVYLESVSNCTIYILTHQLRIHTCSNCKLYVRANSHPIIEDCVQMGFAWYDYKYDTLEADIETAGLQQASHWNTVKDFRWHKTTHSPNWYEITPVVLPTPPPSDKVEGGVAIDAETVVHSKSVEKMEAKVTPEPSSCAAAAVEDDDDEM